MSSSWDNILDPGEEILWQGQPDTRVSWRFRDYGTLLFGLVFAGFALFWMIMASQAPGAFWMFGLIHFFVGLSVAVGPVFWSAWRRRHTWYTLTSARAFIATDLPLRGRKLKSWPITKNTPLSLDETSPGSAWFAEELRRGKNRTYSVDIGFERIENAAKIYQMLRNVQRNSATAGQPTEREKTP